MKALTILKKKKERKNKKKIMTKKQYFWLENSNFDLVFKKNDFTTIIILLKIEKKG